MRAPTSTGWKRRPRVQPGTRTLLVQNTLAALGPAGGGLTVRRPRDLVRPAIARIALAEPASPLGRYTRALLESLDLYTTLLPAPCRWTTPALS